MPTCDSKEHLACSPINPTAGKIPPLAMPPLTAGASLPAMDSPASSSSPSSSSSAFSAAGLPKVYRRRKKPPSAGTGEIAAAELPLPDSPEYESREVSEEERACVECSTSSTPLWRRGPAGPKSLCNACGLRYKKRNRTCSKSTQSLNNNTVMEKVERHAKDVLLLQRKVAGREEAEAARLLMALSSGISYFDFPAVAPF